MCFHWTKAGPDDAMITADTALRLARYFGTSDRFWINLQSRYNLEIERNQIGEALEAITPLGGV